MYSCTGTCSCTPACPPGRIRAQLALYPHIVWRPHWPSDPSGGCARAAGSPVRCAVVLVVASGTLLVQL